MIACPGLGPFNTLVHFINPALVCAVSVVIEILREGDKDRSERKNAGFT